jgi:hypothetical protein
VFWAYRAEDGLEIDNASNYVIDMTRAGFTSAMPDDRKTTLRAISAKLPAKAEHAVIGVSPPSVVAPTKLFQYDTPEVWESSPGFPVDLSVRFDQCRHVAGYEFVSFRQKDLAYFPKKWIARFSNDKSSVSSSDALEIDQLVEETILKDEWKLRRPLAERGCYSVANFRFLEGFDPRALRIAKIRFHD